VTPDLEKANPSSVSLSSSTPESDIEHLRSHVYKSVRKGSKSRSPTSRLTKLVPNMRWNRDSLELLRCRHHKDARALKFKIPKWCISQPFPVLPQFSDFMTIPQEKLQELLKPRPKHSTSSPFSTAPEEIRQEIISYLDYNDAWSLKQTSRQFHNVSPPRSLFRKVL